MWPPRGAQLSFDGPGLGVLALTWHDPHRRRAIQVARRVVIRKTDDLDGAEASQTVSFTIDGAAYEIDLTDTHAEELRAVIEPFITAARRVGGAGWRASTRAVQAAQSYDPKAVRAWAGSHHIEIPARGRIPANVVAQFHAAGN